MSEHAPKPALDPDYRAAVPSQTFQHSSTTHASIAHIWSKFDDPQTWEAVPGVDRVIDPEFDASGTLRRFEFESLVGGKTYRGKASPAGREENKLIAWDIATSELTGKVMVALSQIGDGTRVYVRLHVAGAGMLGGLFFPVIASAIGNGFHETVEDFVVTLSA